MKERLESDVLLTELGGTGLHELFAHLRGGKLRGCGVHLFVPIQHRLVVLAHRLFVDEAAECEKRRIVARDPFRSPSRPTPRRC